MLINTGETGGRKKIRLPRAGGALVSRTNAQFGNDGEVLIKKA